MPRGGVDAFGCSREVRDRIVQFQEVNTNLIALLLWVGYRREYVLYDRQARLEGKSAWTVRKKLRYAPGPRERATRKRSMITEKAAANIEVTSRAANRRNGPVRSHHVRRILRT